MMKTKTVWGIGHLTIADCTILARTFGFDNVNQFYQFATTQQLKHETRTARARRASA